MKQTKHLTSLLIITSILTLVSATEYSVNLDGSTELVGTTFALDGETFQLVDGDLEVNLDDDWYFVEPGTYLIASESVELTENLDCLSTTMECEGNGSGSGGN